jgi:hypothetical protein
MLFEKEIKEEFNNNKSKLNNDLLSYVQIYNNIVVGEKVYFMKKIKLDFIELMQQFNLLL